MPDIYVYLFSCSRTSFKFILSSRVTKQYQYHFSKTRIYLMKRMWAVILILSSISIVKFINLRNDVESLFQIFDNKYAWRHFSTHIRSKKRYIDNKISINVRYVIVEFVNIKWSHLSFVFWSFMFIDESKFKFHV